MAGVKEQVIEMIRYLPEDVTVDDILAELYFKLKVDAGLRELDEGKYRGILLEKASFMIGRLKKWV